MQSDNTLLIELMRHRAKRLRAKDGFGTLAAAQRCVAEEHGFSNWSQMIATLSEGAALWKGPLSEVSGLDRGGIYRFLTDAFREAVSDQRIGLELDYQNYAGPLSSAFTMDVDDWFREQYPELAELFPGQVERAAAELQQDGPWRDLSVIWD